MKWFACLLLAVLLSGCAVKAPVAPPTMPAAPATLADPAVGYLQAQVNAGEKGDNSPIAGVEVRVLETGEVYLTDTDGRTKPIRLPALQPHPVFPEREIGVYTLVITRPGWVRLLHHTYVHGGSTPAEPTLVYNIMVRGEGESTVTDDPGPWSRTQPMTQGPNK